MLARKKFWKSTATLGFCFLLSGGSVHGGLLSILKNGRPEPKVTPSSFQRVAFVGEAEVKSVQGTAEMLAGIDVWTPIIAGTRLVPGDLIRTQKGRVVLKMAQSGSFVAVTPYTILRLNSFEKGWDPSVLSGREESKGFLVRSLRGQAEYQCADKTWKALAVNTVVPIGSVVRTKANSTMDFLHTETGMFLRLNANAETILDPTKQYGPPEVAVQTKGLLGRGVKTAQVDK